MRTRTLYKLNALKAKALKEPGRHSDGGGLYLNVSKSGAKSWLFMCQWEGKRIELGLGSQGAVDLATARDKAQVLRESVAAGIDPRKTRDTPPEPEKAVVTFAKVAEDYIEDQRGDWKNDKHTAQWFYTLSIRKDESGAYEDAGYCQSLRGKSVENITTEDVLSVLKPVWQVKRETARRLQGRIERVLDAAQAKGYRNGVNPARWRGHLDKLLPKKEKLSRGHHKAMPYSDVPSFYQKILGSKSNSSLALAFTILTAGRSGEILGATWAEIDRDNATWTVPAERMKANKIHVVPLSAEAMSIIDIMDTRRRVGTDYIFPGIGGRSGRLSVMAMTMVLRRAGAGDFTVHGFRSSFRDWAGDETDYAREDIELCLAHAIGNEVEKAYRRGNALEKRRVILDTWAEFCARKD